MSRGNGTAPMTTTWPPTRPLSSRERDAQRQAIIQHLNALTIQVMELSKALEEIQTWRAVVDGRHDDTFPVAVAAHANQAQFQAWSFWPRVRWLVMGR